MGSEADPQATTRLQHLARACEKYFHELSQGSEARKVIGDPGEYYWASRQLAEFNFVLRISRREREGS